MGRRDLQQLSKEQLIELVLRLQRPDRDSRTSSKPPSTDKKEKRENSPDGAKLGHEPHNRRLADDPDEIRDHVPGVCAACGGAYAPDAEQELIGEYDDIEIPPVKSHVIRHRGFTRRCAHCRAKAPPPAVASTTPPEPVDGRAAHPCAGDLFQGLPGAVLRARFCG